MDDKVITVFNTIGVMVVEILNFSYHTTTQGRYYTSAGNGCTVLAAQCRQQ